jgi:hypothetical protein
MMWSNHRKVWIGAIVLIKTKMWLRRSTSSASPANYAQHPVCGVGKEQRLPNLSTLSSKLGHSQIGTQEEQGPHTLEVTLP